MSTSVVDFARTSVEAAKRWKTFEAQETMKAGPIEAAAHVRFREPDDATVEYSKYASPLPELEEMLGGHVDFVEDELRSMTLVHADGRTWHVQTKPQSVLVRPGRTLYDPLPTFSSIAEVRFLRTLTSDYLIRDLGESSLRERPVRGLAIKPKNPRVLYLLKNTTYPFSRAEIFLDTETRFPLRIRFVPLPDSPLAPFLFPDGWVSIDYEDVELGPLDPAFFLIHPEQEQRTFRESFPPSDKIAYVVPFDLDLEGLMTGEPGATSSASVVVDDRNERAYVTFHAALPRPAGMALYTAWIGNFLSRAMARRRSIIAEHGDPLDLNGHKAIFLDRNVLWQKKYGQDTPRPMIEVSWEQDGVFLILSGERVAKDDLLSVAGRIRARATKPS